MRAPKPGLSAVVAYSGLRMEGQSDHVLWLAIALASQSWLAAHVWGQVSLSIHIPKLWPGVATQLPMFRFQHGECDIK